VLRSTGKFTLSAVCLAALGSIALNANAALDVIAEPPATDPSHFVDQPADPSQALIDLLNAPEARRQARSRIPAASSRTSARWTSTTCSSVTR
jgi:hypothetical protein